MSYQGTYPQIKRFLYIWVMLLYFSVMCYGQKNDRFSSFGEEIKVEKPTEISEYLQEVIVPEAERIQISGEVAEVCQMAGCWMTLVNDQGIPVRVTFKDYGFFVPKDISGKKVIIQGAIAVTQLDEETARHYAQDAGKELSDDLSEEDLIEISIIADGVLVSNE